MLDERDLNYIIKAHRESLDPKKTTRYWDEKTPYSMHPIWCAMSLLHETSLPEDLRKDGSQALLYHDILEDTQFPLPPWLSNRVIGFVKDMTFESSEQEWKEIWTRPKEIILLKLYDKTSNLMDGIWMQSGKRKEYGEKVSRLCSYVMREYGELNITRIARAIV